jgi:hypothetical protein
VGGYKVTVRHGPRVRKERFDDLASALHAMERAGRELERNANRGAVDVKLLRRFEPVQQVAARIELSGPARLRAGVDVRGDGSAEGYTGRVRRRLVEQRKGESAYDALRRALRVGD